MNKAIKSAIAFMKSELEQKWRPDEWQHIEHIWGLAQGMWTAHGEGDGLVIALGAILYDSLDVRFFLPGELSERRMIVAELLRGFGLSLEQFRKLYAIIEHAESQKNPWKPDSAVSFLELRIVEEAYKMESAGTTASF